MKFITGTILTLSAFAATSNAQSTLEEKWAIGDEPTFTYDSLDFSLTFPITDFIIPNQAYYEMYTSGCKEEGTLLANTTSGLIGYALDDTDNAVSQSDVTMDQSATITISVNPEVISASDLYTEDTTFGDVSAQVIFCVRFGLTTPSDDKTEVNFLETVITLDIELSDGFQIGSIAVEPKDKLVRTAAQAYEVEGYVCTDEEIAGDMDAVRNQGAQIRVCVRPTLEARQDGIYMRRIDSFTWSRVTPPITQEAVFNGEPSSNTLTELFCEPGELVCNFVSILFASFYATQGEVAGSGIASMQFGGDNTYIDLEDGLGGYQYDSDGNRLEGVEFFKKRRSLRQLQEGDEAATSEFDISFEVDQGSLTFADTNSGATSTFGAVLMSMSLSIIAGVITLM